MSFSDTTAATTFPVPRLDRGALRDSEAWRARLRRVAVPAAAVAVVVGVALAVGGPGRTLTDALSRAFNADPRWIVAAVVFEFLSFAGYSLLLWHVAGGGSSRLGLRASTQLSLAGAAATRLVPTAGVGGAALTLWALRRAGHPGRAGLRTLLTFLVVLYAVFLIAIAVAGTLVATGTVAADGPLALSAAPAAFAFASMAIAVALALRHPGAPVAEAVAGIEPTRPARIRHAAGVLSDALRDAFALLRRADPRLLGAPAWWAFDIAVLWSAFEAVGSPPPLAVLVLAYFVGQIANTVPLPGSVSTGTVGMLLAFGAPAGVALTAVLAYRAIAIWVPGTAGTLALAGLRRTVARWEHEEPAATRATEATGTFATPARAAVHTMPVREPGEPRFAREPVAA